MNYKFSLAAALLVAGLSARGQAPRQHPYEIGAEGASYVMTPAPDRERFQAFSGAFFRYAPQRLGVRAGVSFGQRLAPDENNCNDCPAGQTAYRSFTWRVGGQYAPLQRVPWLYTFLDVAYRTTRARGHYTGGLCGCLDYDLTATTPAWGAQAGLGAAWRVLPRVQLAPEVYYEGFRGHTTSEYFDNRTGRTSSYTQLRNGQHTPAFRLQGSVTF